MSLGTVELGNSAGECGGGIYGYSNTLAVMNCTLSDNSAGYYGGAVFGYSNTLTVTSSAILDNSAVDGGGIHSLGTLIVADSILRGNSASGNGGGIYSFGTLALRNATLWGNSASGGGGIYIYGSPPVNGGLLPNTLNNTIVAGNQGATGPDIYHASGDLSGMYNLLGNGSGQAVLVDEVDGNQVGTSEAPIDPMLDANGVPTLGSPAINAGSNALAVDDQDNPLLVDLAGRQRILYGTVDIGAYEYGLPGDASEDYEVGPDDAAVLASHWLSDDDVSWDDGDFNGDGRVDDLDASIMAANWGNSVPEGSGTAKPETPVVVERARLVGPCRLDTTGLVAPARTTLGLAARTQTPVEGAAVVPPEERALAHDVALAEVYGQAYVQETMVLSPVRRKLRPLVRPVVDLAMMEV